MSLLFLNHAIFIYFYVYKPTKLHLNPLNWNNTLKWSYCFNILKILLHVLVKLWPSSGRYIFFFFFTSVTKGKMIWFMIAWLLYLCFVLMLFLVWLLLYSNNQTRKSINTKHNKYNRHAITNQIILPATTRLGRALTQSTTSITGMLSQTR